MAGAGRSVSCVSEAQGGPEVLALPEELGLPTVLQGIPTAVGIPEGVPDKTDRRGLEEF